MVGRVNMCRRREMKRKGKEREGKGEERREGEIDRRRDMDGR
jgi:hypothetical protein